MSRRPIGSVLLATMILGCSSAEAEHALVGELSPAEAGAGDAELTGTETPLSVVEETAFCDRRDTMSGGACRVRTSNEPNPASWSPCAQSSIAALAPNYLVPLHTRNTPMTFGKRRADGSIVGVATVYQGKYIVCSRSRLGTSAPPRAIVYATAGATLVDLHAENPVLEAQEARAVVRYDNSANIDSSPYLEAFILYRDNEIQAWKVSGSAVLPNDQKSLTVRGLVPPNSAVRLEIRGHRQLIEEVEATIVSATLTLPRACDYDEVTRTCD